MNAKDIQIGNWVYSLIDRYGHIEKKPVRITGIRTDSDYSTLLQTSESDVWYHIETYEPIPITPEILEKNGFKFVSPCINDNKDAWVYEWPNEKPNYTPHAFLLMSHHNKAEFPNFWIYAPNNPDIVYVHQLQHALRLCGIEKDIEL